ncbi:MAG: hypothetical protein JWQ62_926 [Lacunisphaera sp.]|nr:hypothetical protein [Lacunisphaera sp.]
MKILFDQGVPVPLRQELPGLEIMTAYQMGWSNLNNGALLKAAEGASITVFVTTDKNLRYQQNLKERRIAMVVLPTTRWPEIKPHVAKIRDALSQIQPGDYRELVW